MWYPIKQLDGMDKEALGKLRAAGIRSSEKLLNAAKDAKGRKALSTQTGINEKTLLKWANAIDRMRLPGMGFGYAELLRLAGVDTVRELKHRNAERLLKAIRDANAQRRLVKFPPSQKAVERWITHAKTLPPPKITY